MLRALFDFISPRACRLCGCRLTHDEEHICSVCDWNMPRTNFFKTPYDNPKARLFWGRFAVEKVAPWVYYRSKGMFRNLIFDIKYYGAMNLAVDLGEIVAREYDEEGFFDDIDLLIPVPLTFFRKLRRGYNQSEMICKGIRRVTRIPIDTKVVKRLRFKSSQTHLGTQERLENVENAFRLLRPERIAGKHILLVDDVITTGATIASCATELSKADDVRISILSLGVVK